MIEVHWSCLDKDNYPYYRTCDECGEGADVDIVAGKPIADVRKFFQFPEEAGLVLCEHCLPAPVPIIVHAET